jgi:hypothetical protein
MEQRLRMLSRVGGVSISILRYALEIEDPYLAQVVRRVEAGEMPERLHGGLIVDPQLTQIYADLSED